MTDYRDPNYRDPAGRHILMSMLRSNCEILVEFDVGMDRRLCGGGSRVDFCVQQRA